MNKKIKSLIKNDEFLINKNNYIMLYFISFILVGPIISLIIKISSDANFSMISVLLIVVIIQIFFGVEFGRTYEYDKNIKNYVKILPITKEEYIKSKFLYAAKVFFKIFLLLLFSTQFITRSIEIINILLISTGLSIIDGAFSVRRYLKEKNVKSGIDENKYLSLILTLIILILFKVKSDYILKKIKFIDSIMPNIKNELNINILIFLSISIIIYFLLMIITIRKEEKDEITII